MTEPGAAGARRWRPLYAIKRRWYRDGRPGWIAKILNGLSAWQYAHGILTAGGRGITLEVRGRSSGRPVRFPLVLLHDHGKRYLVSMLGTHANWVRNVQADQGRAVLLSPHGREALHLVELPTNERAPLLRLYLDQAPGARPHFPIARDAPLDQFETIAADFPVFRVEPDQHLHDPPTPGKP